MEDRKITRSISKKFYSEMNSKTNFDEMQTFFDYCKNLYDDLTIIQKFYSKQFAELSKKNIKVFLDEFDKIYSDITNCLFKTEIRKIKSKCFKKSLRFSIRHLIDLNSKIYDKENDFNHTLFSPKEFEQLVELSNKIFMLEKQCSEYTKMLWKCTNPFHISLEKGMFVKIITEENWRGDKITSKLKKYFRDRIGISVSYINDKKSKFFKDEKLNVLAGIIYASDDIIAGNYVDGYTEEVINGKKLVANSVNHTAVNKVYDETIKGKHHEIFANSTLTATPIGVITNENCHNEIILNKNYAKPIAVFYLNENSKQYAEKLAKKHNLHLYKLPVVSNEEIINTNQTL